MHMFLYTVSMQKIGYLPRKKSFSIDSLFLEMSPRRRYLANSAPNLTLAVLLSLLFTGAFASTTLAQSHAPTLIPTPRELHTTSLTPITSATVVVTPSSNDSGETSGISEDLFTAQDL